MLFKNISSPTMLLMWGFFTVLICCLNITCKDENVLKSAQSTRPKKKRTSQAKLQVNQLGQLRSNKPSPSQVTQYMMTRIHDDPSESTQAGSQLTHQLGKLCETIIGKEDVTRGYLLGLRLREIFLTPWGTKQKLEPISLCCMRKKIRW